MACPVSHIGPQSPIGHHWNYSLVDTSHTNMLQIWSIRNQMQMSHRNAWSVDNTAVEHKTGPEI